MQPKPIPDDSQPIAEMVIADIRERMEQGRAKYGVELQAHNGRKALQDAYEEVLDLAQYIRQEMAERDALAAQNVELREALERVITLTSDDNVDSYMLNVHEAERVLALPLPAAAANVAEWREKAELLDWVLVHAVDYGDRTLEFVDGNDVIVTPLRFNDPDDFAELDSEEWTPQDLLAALRAARGGR